MPGAFGLADDHCHTRVPRDLMVEANPRLSIWELLEHGMLVEGTVTEVAFEGTGDGPAASRTINIRREGALAWDSPMDGVDRRWWRQW